MRYWHRISFLVVSVALLFTAAICSAPRPDHFTWVRALPKGEGDWPRFCEMTVGSDGKLWAIETAGPEAIAFSSDDAIHWTRTPANGAWGERYRPAFAFFKGRLWLLGGRAGTVEDPTYHSDVWSSENGTDWRLVARDAGWSPRWDHTVLVFDNRLWVIGGFGRDGDAADVWSTPDGANWTRATEKPPWSKWKYRSFVVFRGRLWAVGFHNGHDIWFSSDGAHWQQATADAGWPADSRYKQAVVFNGFIWVMGGADARGNFENDVWYSADGVRWSQQTLRAPWNPRAANYSVAFRDKLWVFGGKNADDDVWYLSHNAPKP